MNKDLLPRPPREFGEPDEHWAVLEGLGIIAMIAFALIGVGVVIGWLIWA